MLDYCFSGSVIVQVYKMSHGIRGRALIINIERFNGPDGLYLRREGSALDVTNLRYMLKEFSFDVKVEENLASNVS